MKNTILVAILIAFLSSSQGAPPPFEKIRPWNLPCRGTVELEHLGDQFGAGIHRDFQGPVSIDPIVTSRLTKEGKVWEISTQNGQYAFFSGTEAGQEARQIYFTSSGYLEMMVCTCMSLERSEI